MATATKAKTEPKRSYKLVKAIQQAIRDNGLPEDVYRDIYEKVTGKRSIREMSNIHLVRILDSMRKDGLKMPPSKNKGTRLCQTPQARKIRSLWLELKNYRILTDPSEKALLAFVHKRTGVERMEWLQSNQMVHIIEELKNWLARIEEKLFQAEVERRGLRKDFWPVEEKEAILADVRQSMGLSRFREVV